MIFRRAFYFTKGAVVHLLRHPLYTLAGILTTAMSLILVGFVGLFIWKAFTDSERNEESRDGMGFSFRHQPAEQVVRQWFKGG